jgi:hypothetical protein
MHRSFEFNAAASEEPLTEQQREDFIRCIRAKVPEPLPVVKPRDPLQTLRILDVMLPIDETPAVVMTAEASYRLPGGEEVVYHIEGEEYGIAASWHTPGSDGNTVVTTSEWWVSPKGDTVASSILEYGACDAAEDDIDAELKKLFAIPTVPDDPSAILGIGAPLEEIDYTFRQKQLESLMPIIAQCTPETRVA